MFRTTLRPHLNTKHMQLIDKAIEHAQNQVMFAWKSVMGYEAQLNNLELNDQDTAIIRTLIEAEKERVEIYTLILENLEQ